MSELNKQITILNLFSEPELKAKIDKIISNLRNIKKNYLKNVNDEIIAHNKFRPVENILESLQKFKDIDPNAF